MIPGTSGAGIVVLVEPRIVVVDDGISLSGRVVVVVGEAVVGGEVVEDGGPASGTTGVVQATAVRPSTAAKLMRNDFGFTGTALFCLCYVQLKQIKADRR